MEELYPDYVELIEEAKSYNSNLIDDRRLRGPFLDSQTGIAQYNCHLWRNKRERQVFQTHSDSSRPGMMNFPFIRYPERRWTRKICSTQLEPAINTINQPMNIITNNLESGPSDRQANQSMSDNCKTSDLSQKSSDSGFASIFNSTNGDISDSESDPTYHLLDLDHPKATSESNTPRADSTGSHSGHSVDSLDFHYDYVNMNSTQYTHGQHQQQLSLLVHEQPKLNNVFDKVKGDWKISDQSIKPTDSINKPTLGFLPQLNKQEKSSTTIQNEVSKRDEELDRVLIRPDSIYDIPNVNINHELKYQNLDSKPMMCKIETCQRPELDQTSLTEKNVDKLSRNEPRCSVQSIREDMSSLTASELALKAVIRTNRTERPYMCTACNLKYKTRPGLTYHFQHTHNVILPRNLPKRKS